MQVAEPESSNSPIVNPVEIKEVLTSLKEPEPSSLLALDPVEGLTWPSPRTVTEPWGEEKHSPLEAARCPSSPPCCEFVENSL